MDALYGPKPGTVTKPVVIVLDNGPVHRSKATPAALDARSHWLTVEWLPNYAPELNTIEPVWGDLKARHLAHQTFADKQALEAAIHTAVADLNTKPRRHPLANQRSSAQVQVHWPGDDRTRVFYACEACGGAIHERHKARMLAGGCWRATAAGDGLTAGFHLSALCSSFESWAEIAVEHAKVYRDPPRLQAW